jgi:hypothetical protein
VRNAPPLSTVTLVETETVLDAVILIHDGYIWNGNNINGNPHAIKAESLMKELLESVSWTSVEEMQVPE